jgi:hypothetical protein
MALEGRFMVVESDSKLRRGVVDRRGMMRPHQTASDMKKTQSISHKCLGSLS